MGKKQSKKVTEPIAPEPPRLASRRKNHQSTFRMGRTIGEKREKVQTANERAIARKKDKKKQAKRTILTTFGFLCFTLFIFGLCYFLFGNGEPVPTVEKNHSIKYEPTIQVIDENSIGGEKPTNRMLSYIGQVEQDLRDLKLTPTKAVIPSGSIREVDIYLAGYSGYIRMHIDRSTATSAEDAERMIRYLLGIGVSDFQYIDVRIGGKAYWL